MGEGEEGALGVAVVCAGYVCPGIGWLVHMLELKCRPVSQRMRGLQGMCALAFRSLCVNQLLPCLRSPTYTILPLFFCPPSFRLPQHAIYFRQAASGGSLTWLPGSQTGYTAPRSLFNATLATGAPGEVEVVDGDGDGDLDVLFTLPTNGTVVWLANKRGALCVPLACAPGLRPLLLPCSRPV
jgi:hypothetical protein